MKKQNDSAVAQERTIFIKRTFNLPLSTVWDAWTKPESFKKWWGPKEFTCPYCNIDFEVGGKYLASMMSPDGTETFSTGTYQEIVPLQKIIYTDSFADGGGKKVPASYYKMPDMPFELLVTVTFEEVNGNKTNMLLKHEGIPEEVYDDCINGWQSSFDKMESNLKQ